MEGYFEFLRLVTLNSLVFIPKFKRGIIFNHLEVEFLFRPNFGINVHEPPKYLVGGYPRVHTNPKSKRFLERMIYHI